MFIIVIISIVHCFIEFESRMALILIGKNLIIYVAASLSQTPFILMINQIMLTTMMAVDYVARYVVGG